MYLKSQLIILYENIFFVNILNIKYVSDDKKI